jgi:hypothetical protein
MTFGVSLVAQGDCGLLRAAPDWSCFRADTYADPAHESALKQIFAAGLDSLRLVLAGIGSLGGGRESGGAVWRVDIRNGEARSIGRAVDLAWPAPSPNGLTVFALRGKQVVSTAVSDGSETLVGAPANWRKLTGVAPDGTVLGFIEDGPRPRPALIQPNGRLAALPARADDSERKRNGLLLQRGCATMPTASGSRYAIPNVAGAVAMYSSFKDRASET